MLNFENMTVKLTRHEMLDARMALSMFIDEMLDDAKKDRENGNSEAAAVTTNAVKKRWLPLLDKITEQMDEQDAKLKARYNIA